MRTIFRKRQEYYAKVRELALEANKSVEESDAVVGEVGDAPIEEVTEDIEITEEVEVELKEKKTRKKKSE